MKLKESEGKVGEQIREDQGTPKGKYNKNESLINVLCSNLHYHFGRCEFKKNLFVNLLMRPIAASTKNDFALFEWNMD